MKLFKKIFFLLALLVISETAVSQSGLIGCYPLDNNANDFSGFNYHGTAFNVTPTSDRFGNANSAYHFSGASSFIQIPTTGYLLNEYTYSAWCKPTSLPNALTRGYYSIIAIGGDLADQIILLGNDYITNFIGFGAGSWSSTTQPHQCYAATLPLINQWYHLVSTRNDSMLTFYVNGILICTTNYSSVNAGYLGTNFGGSIGSREVANIQNFVGDMDDVRIFNRVLTQTEIQTMSAPCSCAMMVDLGADTSVCSGNVITLNAGHPGSTYSWYINNNIIPGAISQTYQPLTNGSFSVVVNGGLCSAADTIIVSFYSLTTNLNTQICQGSSFNLPWGGTTNTAGIYSHTYTSTSRCDSIVSITLSINSVITTNQTASICQGSTYSLPWGGSAGTAGTYSHTYTSTTGCDSIVNIVLEINSISSTTQNVSICQGQNHELPDGTLVTSSGTYSTTLIGSSGCDSSVTTNLALYPLLSVTAAGSATICEGNVATIFAIANGGNGGPYSYSWNGGLLNGSSLTVAPAHDSTFIVIVTDGCGTPSTKDSIKLTVNPMPSVSFLPQQTSGCAPVQVNFVQDSIGLPVSTYIWILGDNTFSNGSNISHVYCDPGHYDVSLFVMTAQGCMNSLTLLNAVIVDDLPHADFSQSVLSATIANAQVTFTDYSSEAVHWEWNFGDASPLVFERNPSHQFRDTGEFNIRLVVQSIAGCIDTTFGRIRIDEDFFIYVPNSFTPNGDGINESFQIYGIGFKDFEMTIFNRWGEEVFHTANTKQSWDGSYFSKNKLCENDVYEYIIKVHDVANREHVVVGRINLIR